MSPNRAFSQLDHSFQISDIFPYVDIYYSTLTGLPTKAFLSLVCYGVPNNSILIILFLRPQCPLRNPVSRFLLLSKSFGTSSFKLTFWSGLFLGDSAKVFFFQLSLSRNSFLWVFLLIPQNSGTMSWVWALFLASMLASLISEQEIWLKRHYSFCLSHWANQFWVKDMGVQCFNSSLWFWRSLNWVWPIYRSWWSVSMLVIVSWLFLVIYVMLLLIAVEFKLGHLSITPEIAPLLIFVVYQNVHCLSH